MKPKNSNRYPKSILLIGPLPPPLGGARVSFKLFFDFIKNHSKAKVKYYDLPLRSLSSDNQIGKVNHFKTIIGVLRSILSLTICRSVVIFGSRGFCFSYGILLCVLSRCLGKHCYIRFFGGRPVPFLKTYPAVVQKFIFFGLRLAKRISIETQIGAIEFPEFLQRKFEIIPGYRHRIPAELPSSSASDASVRFVYVGGISEEKGIETLLNSFSELLTKGKKDRLLELHLYGTGSDYYMDKISKISGVYYHGVIDNIELRRQLTSYDVFVFPSVYDNEGHPGVLIEALMAGLPIISSDQTVIREFLSDKFNCLLVNPGDIHGLFSAMDTMAKDHALRRRLSKAALETSSMFDAVNVLPVLAKTFAL
jgi:glycosyltransferase involved in cell wall biosynthesis